MQELLAEHIELLGEGYTLVRREYMTAIGPVDILCRDADGRSVAVEIKRRGEIDGVEQLTRYLELLNRDTLLAPVTGVFAAQQIKPQARTLAADRGIRCLTLDYDVMRGLDSDEFRLFLWRLDDAPPTVRTTRTDRPAVDTAASAQGTGR